MLKNAYEGLNARPKVYLSKEYLCEMYPTCVSSKLCEFIQPVYLSLFHPDETSSFLHAALLYLSVSPMQEVRPKCGRSEDELPQGAAFHGGGDVLQYFAKLYIVSLHWINDNLFWRCSRWGWIQHFCICLLLLRLEQFIFSGRNNSQISPYISHAVVPHLKNYDQSNHAFVTPWQDICTYGSSFCLHSTY